MKNIIIVLIVLLLALPSIQEAATFLEPGQARINLKVTNPRAMDQVRDLMCERFDAVLVRSIDELSFMTFIIGEQDLETIFHDPQLSRLTDFVEEDAIRYIPEFQDVLRAFLFGGEGIERGIGESGGSPSGVPNDPRYGNQWGPACIDAEAAWDAVPDAPDVLLAIVDTGVDISHEDLRDHYDTSIDRDFANNDYNANDDMGHGTHVAGISAAVTGNNVGIAGLAPVTIMGVKVLNWMGFGFDSDIVAGINYATDHGADVINLSLGGTSYTQGLRNACDNAFYDNDVVVVAAAGNSNTSQDFYPASFASVIGVAALANCTTRASFSNFGYDNVEVSAPGQNIYSTLPDHLTFWNLFGMFPFDYGYLDGTSMASPHVAGVAAGYRAYAPGLSAQQIRNVLDNQADDLGDPYYYGNGRVDYYPFQDGPAEGYAGETMAETGGRALMGTASGRPLVEQVLDLLKYRQVTVEVLDASGELVETFTRRLDRPEMNVPVDLSRTAARAFRLRVGDRVSPTIPLS
jgi:hypothetical protein